MRAPRKFAKKEEMEEKREERKEEKGERRGKEREERKKLKKERKREENLNTLALRERIKDEVEIQKGIMGYNHRKQLGLAPI